MQLAYNAAILLSAFLLFTVQLMIGKILLPYFGGTPAVWNTSMMFYQILLLAGYVYAHLLSTKVSPRLQPVIHWALFAAGIVGLSFTVVPDAVENASQHPISTQLALMSAIVGLPFLALSATAPLIQRWFFISVPDASHKVYWLYATSNFGSFLALLSYPLVIEPLLPLDQQEFIWRVLQIVLLGLFVICGIRLIRTIKAAAAPIAASQPETVKPISGKTIFTWVMLAAVPSSLILGVTTKITTDIASMPLLWVIPLALYLLTFVITFRQKAPFKISDALAAALFFSILTAIMEVSDVFSTSPIAMAVALLAFTTLSYTCHRLLYDRRPDATRLTSFYIWLSVGGALGGMFNSLVVPNLFSGAYEFPLVLVLGLGIALILLGATPVPVPTKPKPILAWLATLAIALAVYGTISPIHLGIHGKDLFSLAILISLISIPLCAHYRGIFLTLLSVLFLATTFFPRPGVTLIHQERNYFGVKKIIEDRIVRHFLHGTTNHGSQIREEKFRLTPITYYNPSGPAADIFRAMDRQNLTANVLIMGLGIGGLSCLTARSDTLSYIEIDPAVVRIATTPEYFTFIRDCGPEENMIIGDGRLELEKLPDQSLDLLFLDAFSSDSVPFHLITRDAMAMYLKKLKPDGAIAVHITNRYFNFTPELKAIARDLNLILRQRIQEPGMLPGTTYPYGGTKYVILTKNNGYIDLLSSQNADWIDPATAIPTHAWTDQYANILRAMELFRIEPVKPN